jgi:hypothetical protein
MNTQRAFVFFRPNFQYQRAIKGKRNKSREKPQLAEIKHNTYSGDITPHNFCSYVIEQPAKSCFLFKIISTQMHSDRQLPV